MGVHALPFQKPNHSLYLFECFHIPSSFTFFHSCFSPMFAAAHVFGIITQYMLYITPWRLNTSNICNVRKSFARCHLQISFITTIPQFLPRYWTIRKQECTTSGSVLPPLGSAIKNLKCFFLKGSKDDIQDKRIEFSLEYTYGDRSSSDANPFAPP